MSEGKLRSKQTVIPVKDICGHLVPAFFVQHLNINEFSATNAEELHRNAMAWLHNTHGTTEELLRTKLVSEIPTVRETGVLKILVTSCGEGNDLPYLFGRFPDAVFYIQDISEQMLTAAIKKAINCGGSIKKFFWLGDACRLPFEDATFDVVYHFGGLNLFSSPAEGVLEMHRVANNGGAVLFGDEGIAPFLRQSETGRALIKNNPLYDSSPPLSSIPEGVEDFKLQYLFHNCFYLVTYRKTVRHNINIDIPHEGYRGGSIRTRFYGQLEGIDPNLRNSLYEAAKGMGMSRVALLQEIIVEGLKKVTNDKN
jgi:ubiquinone/menaquinone biosynthesis C-methylase UbiE